MKQSQLLLGLVLILFKLDLSFLIWKPSVLTFRKYQATSGSVSSNAVSQAKVLNKLIVDTFSVSNTSDFSFKGLKSLLNTKLDVISQINVVTLMHRCRKAKVDVLDFLPVDCIRDRLSVRSGVLSAQGLSNAFYSLHGLPEDSFLVTTLLPNLAEQIDSCNEILTGQHISNILYSMKNFNTSGNGVIILEALERLIIRNHHATATTISMEDADLQLLSASMTTQGLGSAFVGLQGLSDEHLVMQRFLAYLGNSFDCLATPFDAQAASNILLGLRSCTAHSQSMIYVLRQLGLRLQDRKVLRGFSSKEMGVALCGLRHMDTNLPDVQQIWSFLNNILDISNSGSFRVVHKVQALSDILRGMIGATSDNEQVRRFLRSLHQVLVNDYQWMKSPLNQNSLSTCLCSLQSMSDSVLEVRLLLQLIGQALDIDMKDNDQMYWTPASISNALFGLQSMSGSPELLAVIRYLSLRIDPSSAIIFTPTEIGRAMYGIHSISVSSASTNGFQPFYLYRLLEKILSKIGLSVDDMGVVDIACAFFGLQNLDAHSDKVTLALANDLTRALSKCYKRDLEPSLEKEVQGKVVCMILHGVSSLGCDFYSTKNGIKLLSIMAKIISNHVQQLNNVEISTALRSMHSIAKMEILPSQEENDLLYTFRGPGPIMSNSPNLSPVTLKLLGCMHDHMIRRKSPLTGDMVSCALYGLQNCSPKYLVVRKISLELADDILISSHKSGWDSHSIASALLGLKCMSSNYYCTRKLLNALAEAVHNSSATFNAQTVGNAFYGLQSLQNVHLETEKLILTLNDKLEAMPHTNSPEYELSGQNIGNALWGLRSMQVNSTNSQFDEKEVLRSIELLTRRINESRAEMSPQNIANSLYALQHISPHFEQVRKLLLALSFKIFLCKQTFTGLDLGMSLFGLRFMDSSIPEVRLIFHLLLQKTQVSDMKMSYPDMNMSIMGLVHATPWLRDWFLQVIASKFPNMKLLT